MNYMTPQMQSRAIDYLDSKGWRFMIDRFDPRPEYRGWWIHDELHPRPTGDSQKLWYAAEIAFNGAGYDRAEISPLAVYYS